MTMSLTIILLKVTGSPLLQWLGRLPRLNEIHMAQYFGVPVGFLIACLAGLGLHAMLEGGIRLRRAIIVALLLAAMPATLWYVAKDLNVFASIAADYWIRDWRILAGVSIALGITIVAAAALGTRPTARAAAAAIAVLLLTCDSIYMGWYPNPRAWSVFEHPVPYMLAILRESPNDRIFAFGAPDANLGSPYRLFLMDSAMVFNPPRMFRLYTHYTSSPRTVLMRAPERLFPEPLLDRANVRLVSARRAAGPIVAEIDKRQYDAVFNDGFTIVFKRPTLPRFLFSSEYQVVSQEAALDAVGTVRSSEIILEQDPGVPNAPNSPGDPAGRWRRIALAALRRCRCRARRRRGFARGPRRFSASPPPPQRAARWCSARRIRRASAPTAPCRGWGDWHVRPRARASAPLERGSPERQRRSRSAYGSRR